MKSMFIKKEDVKDDNILITGKQFHYLKRVLRFKEGEGIELKTKNKVYLSKLNFSSKNTLHFKITDIREIKKAKFNIIICLSLIKEKSFLFALQKLTELSVSSIIPYSAIYSNVHIEDEKQKNKRWLSICKEAAEQSGNDSYPYIEPIITDINKIKTYNMSNKIILNEKENIINLKQSFKQIDSHYPIMIMVGPEGGFTDEEISKTKALGFISASLGDYILRSETASIVAVSNLLFYLS